MGKDWSEGRNDHGRGSGRVGVEGMG